MTQPDSLNDGLNAEFETLTYSISHDLGAPTRAVSSYAMIFEELYGGVLDDEGRRLLSVIRSESARMGDMIDGFVRFSVLARQHMQIAEIDMTALARTSVNEQLSAGSGGALRVEVETLPRAAGDQHLLSELWDRLISNAIKFSSKGSNPQVTISGSAEGNEAIYRIADNGVGFDPENGERLFAPFKRLHRAEEFPGIGLGLAIARRIVLRHGGRIWAQSQEGGGATFAFALPLVPEA